MTTEQIQQAAAAAAQIETEMGIPAELMAALCLADPEWIGNNPFHITAPRESAGAQVAEVEEVLTPREIRSVVDSGRRIVDMGPLVAGARRVRIQDFYMSFSSLEEACRYYGRSLMRSKSFAARWSRYQAHRNVRRFLQDLAGNDGFPAMWPARQQAVLDSVSGSVNVKAALAEARATQQQRT